MSVTIEQMLEHRDTVYLWWVDPHQALDPETGAFTACVHHRATVRDCVGMARHNSAEEGHPPYPNDKEALLDFIAVMWAEAVPSDLDADTSCCDSPSDNKHLP